MVHQPRNPQSSRGWRNNDAGGVGLGIAVALEKAGDGISQRKLHSTAAPIAITSPRTSPGPKGCAEIYGFSCCDSPRAPVAGEFYVADFLRDCFLCRKKLRGKDIFMYREKAFCSTECRYQQMRSDEYQERYGARSMKRSPEIASSPCAAGQLFFTAGIEVS